MTDWRDGYIDQRTSLFATSGPLSTGVDFHYLSDNGYRPNNDNLIREIYWHTKVQVSPSDMAFSLVKYEDQQTGDLTQDYSNLPTNLGQRSEDREPPGVLLLGWNHTWSPGVHTLFLGGRLASDQVLTAPNTTQLLLERSTSTLEPGFLSIGPTGTLQYTSPALQNANPPAVTTNPDGSLDLSSAFQSGIAPYLGTGTVTGAFGDHFNFSTQRRFAIGSGELQQIWQTSRNTLLFGGRWQSGVFNTKAELDLVDPRNVPYYPSPADLQHFWVPFDRESLYTYDFYRLTPGLTVIVGGSWDRLKRPEDFRNPPVSNLQVKNERRNGKLGFTYAPSRWITVRGAYTEALGGVTFDDDVQLEPVQFAGFNQDFRTVISESLVGSVEAPVYQNRGLSIEGSLPSKTWWAASFDRLSENVQRSVGDFDLFVAPVFPSGMAILPSVTDEVLAYRENVFTAGFNQLVGREFAFGAYFRRTFAELHDTYPQIPVLFGANAFSESGLDEWVLTGNWNSSSGWFARVEAHRYSQTLGGVVDGYIGTTPPGDAFWQDNALIGYRFDRARAEVSVGVLDMTNRNYNLSPLTYFAPDLPHSRTPELRVRVGF